MTIQHDGQRLADSLEELDLEGWGRDGVDGDSGEVIWEITDEQTLEDGGEVVEARINQRKGSAQGEQLVHAHFGLWRHTEIGHTDDALGSTATDAQTTREHLKRFSKMCLGSYGGMGVLFFGEFRISESSIDSTDEMSVLAQASNFHSRNQMLLVP